VKVVLFIFFLSANIIFANINNTASQDSSRTSTNDTSAVKKTQPKGYQVDAVIYSSSNDSLIFNVTDKRMNLFGNGHVKYKTSELKSEIINMDFVSHVIYSEGKEYVDSSGAAKTKGTPVLSEGGEVYEGYKINYDYKTQRGLISLAKNASDGAWYRGDKVKKIDKQTYFVKDGKYTTCDKDTSDYDFRAKEMKVMMKDKIIAKWIWLYIGGVPLPVPIPFGVFPNESGRRSGLIIPAYGESSELGHYFSHLGYFWAISDYLDANLTTDLYLKGSYALNSRIRYAKRYDYSGNIELGYSDRTYGEESDPGKYSYKDYKITLSHNQKIDPTTRFDANLNFQSTTFYKNTSTNYNDMLNQSMHSSAALFKSWDESGNSMSLSYSRDQNLANGSINEILPSLSFYMAQKYPFRSQERESATDLKWYELIGVNYSGSFENIRKSDDTTGLHIRAGIEHTLNAGLTKKIGYFNISPSIGYVEKWYNKRIEKYSIAVEDRSNKGKMKDSVITKDLHEINMVRSFSTSVGVSTKLYGVFQPGILGIEAVRHTLTPSVSYNYTPDFSEDKWGYYGKYRLNDGSVVKYNKYDNEVYGGAGSGESQSISFQLGNIFEMKTAKDPSDTSSQEKKIKLLNASAGLNYNFAADSMRLSNLSLSYNTQIGEMLNFNGSSSYSFYDYDRVGTSRHQINKYLISEGKGLLRMTSFSLNISSSFSGEKLKSKEAKKDTSNNDEMHAFNKNDNSMNLYKDVEADFTIPWNVSLNYNFLYSKPYDISYKYSDVSASFSMNFTKTWKVSTTGSYSFQDKKFSAPIVRLYKDLHCWEMNFTWYPVGSYKGYRFEIKLKAPQLQDLKLTQNRGFFSGR
jgi:hypothetical protein